MARLELALSGLCDHMSGDGVSALQPASVAGFEEAAERGLGMGLNSVAFALNSLGDDMGDEGRLAAKWVCACACERTGEGMGDTLRAVMYEGGFPPTSGEATGVCGRREPMGNGELGKEEVGVSGLLTASLVG